MKFLILFLLGLSAVTYGLPILGGYQQVSTELAQTDNQIQSLINAGLELILQDGSFSTQFSLSVVNSISQQTVDGATNYRFDVTFKNTNGQTITATFEATYTYSTAFQSIDNLDYQVHTYTVAETVTQTFTTLTQEFIQSSSLVQSVVDFGVHEILNYALKAEEIQDTHFQISNINSVATQAYDSAVFYNCSVHLTNADGLLLSTYFTVFNHATLSLSIIVDYSFAVIDNQETIGEINDIIQLIAPNETEYTAISAQVVQNDPIVQEALYTGAEQVVQIGLNQNTLNAADFTVSQITQAWSQIIGNGLYYKFSVVLGNSAGQTITTTFEVYYQIYIDETRFVSYTFSLDGSTTQELIYVVPILTLNGDYIKCSESEIRTSTDLFNALDFGANTVAQRGYDAGNIPAGQYYLFQIESAEKFNFTLGLAYRFKIGFTNKNGVLVQTNFTTLVLATEYSLSGYSYQANLNGYGCSSANGNTSSGVVIDVDCTITSSVIIGSKDQNNTNPTNPGTNNTNPVTSPGSDYILLTASEIQDSIVQSCITYGMNGIVQIGVQIGSFPFSKWNLTEVIAVYQKNQNWGTTYKITLQLTNAKGLKLETTFTLSYNFVTLLIRLNSYIYTVGAFIHTKTVATTSGLPVVTPTLPTNTSNLPFSESNAGLAYASNGYYQIPIHWVDLSEDIQNCINFGANAVVQIGVNQEKIPVSDYIIYNVVWVQRYVGARGSYYAIRLYLTNVDNVNLVTTFTTYILKATKEISLYSYAYTASNILTQWYTPGGNQDQTTSSNVTTVTNMTSLVTTSSWDALTDAEIQANPEAQQAIRFGAEYITNVSIQSNSAPAGTYAISTIKSVARKSSIRGVFYLCSVVLTSATNVKITTNYTIYIDRSTESLSVSSYQYQVSNDQDTVSQQPDETSGYIAINITDILGNTQISAYINFGISQVLQNSETYTISAVNSAYTQVINGAYYYKFNVTLTSEDVTVELNFIFYYKPATAEQVVTAYSINTIINTSTETPAPSDQTYTEEDSTNTDFNTIIEAGSQKIIQQLYNNNVIVSTDFTVSQVTKVLTSKVETSVYYQFELTLKNTAGISLNLTLNVKQSGSATDVELVSYLVLGTSTDQTDALVSLSQTTSTQTSSAQQVTSTQIETDTEIQAAINYGAQEVITQISQNYNVSSDFQITETTSVYQEIVSSSSYTVKVTLTNSEGRKADAHYSVNYQSSTNVKQVISSKYVVY